MELDGADEIQVTQEGEQAATELVIPQFNFVIVTAGHDEGLNEVKVHSTDLPVVLFEANVGSARSNIHYYPLAQKVLLWPDDSFGVICV